MRFTDREKVADIMMRLWGQDISDELLFDPDLKYSDAIDAWLVDDLDYVIDYAKSWKNGTGDFYGHGVGDDGECFVDVKDVIEDYDQTAASLYDGGWRAEDRDDIQDEYDFTDAQVDKNMQETR